MSSNCCHKAIILAVRKIYGLSGKGVLTVKPAPSWGMGQNFTNLMWKTCERKLKAFDPNYMVQKAILPNIKEMYFNIWIQ